MGETREILQLGSVSNGRPGAPRDGEAPLLRRYIEKTS
jgi:hypothetical protein